MTQTTFTDNVLIDGSQDITQLTVEGHSTQTQALQSWQDSADTPFAKLTGDGRLQVGDFEPAGSMVTDDALIEAHRSATSTRPKRGLHTLGRIGGAVTDAITWVVQELELLGGGGVSSLQTALRAQLIHKNTGTSTTAELRAGDFETTNETGTTGARVGKATGIRAAVRNLTGAFLEQAIGAEVSLENSGTITDAYGLKVADVQQGSNRNYAVHTGSGSAHFGDDLELLLQSSTPVENPPAGFMKLYPKEIAGEPHLYIKDAAGVEREVFAGSGAPTAGQTLFTVEGALIVVANPLRIYNQVGSTKTISKVFLAVARAPTGAALIVDIHKNGTTIFTNQSNRPQIAVGSHTGQSTSIDVPAWGAGEYLEMYIDQIGSIVAGENLAVHVVYS